jgi:hypothetical protein
VDVLQCINGLRVAGHDLPMHDFMWPALRAVLNLSQLHTCLLPLSRGSIPQPLLEAGLRCFTNHPFTDAQVHTHLDPFTLAMHEFYAAGDGVHMYFLHVPPELLDLLLPLCMLHVRHLVLAVVPLSYIESRQPHRCVWFHDQVWSRRHGLFLRVVQPHGAVCPVGWLLLFPDLGSRVKLLHGRVGSATCEVLWDARNPHTLTFMSSLRLLHFDVVGQGVRASRRWLELLARRGGVSIAQLPPDTPDPPRSFLLKHEYQHLGEPI